MKEELPDSIATLASDDAAVRETEPQEGGTRAWLTVVGSALVYFASFGFMNSFGFFQDFYQANYLSNYPPSTMAFIGTLQISLMYVMGSVAGSLFDSYGLKWLYPVGALGCYGSLIGLSFSQKGAIWQQFLSQGVLFGLTVGFGVQPALAVAGQHFKQRRALAMGMVAESYTTLYHPSAPIHSYLLPLINSASFFGRIVGGFLADRVGLLNLLYPMTFISGVFCLAIWLPADNVATIVAFVCLYGFSSGIFISVTPAAVAQISPNDRIGARIGAFFTLAAVATLIGTPIAGALVDENVDNGYRNVILFAGLTLSIGSVFILCSRIICEKDLRRKW
ncbi:MFS 1 domain containing protein [Pyrenophora tritici-repentis]|uniref:MFS-1 domain containing protein n=1 Tax=Pyrenophora tritici-repentis TaxID=45151 RepID=A0A922N2D4_9PLEO|nr:MFS 1 domain containing protein [Pyrenophora tritici-repentis]KAI1507755.1 MFS-1 domain containing protein [Pyrenophora tritici-repentis]KAI1525779.1 AraJ Arabinose efflux permease [Pyrenophora tritici-repentis]KAI1564161.1 AraJ Arabinose efflux permease [Pyrenophora tritici-repentis]KAI1669274.1 MFS-1 domain containing protein [Pyrenophora tritici-repentis]